MRLPFRHTGNGRHPAGTVAKRCDLRKQVMTREHGASEQMPLFKQEGKGVFEQEAAEIAEKT